MRTRIKVCCISSVDEARLAIMAGADALGLVSRMPSGPGTISDRAIATISRTVPPGIDTFLLTSETQPDAVVDHVSRCGTSVVQLVSSVPPETYAALRKSCPNVRIVQVLHVEDECSVAEAKRVSSVVDAILLDSGRPNATVPELGGTGRVHDWSISAQIAEAVSLPVFLAGGLEAGNVALAIARVQPFGVDLCSGVRAGGDLDESLLRGFIASVHSTNE